MEKLTGYGIIGIGVILLVVLHWIDKLFPIFDLVRRDASATHHDTATQFP